MEKVFKTPKGTNLPLLNLRGKEYLQVAYRLQWLNEDVSRFSIDTTYLTVSPEESVVKALICIYDDAGKLVRSATAVKRETKKDFGDHLEKAETAAIGRALSMLGYGTQYALSDLDEGDRLADSPLNKAESTTQEIPKTRSSFRKETATPAAGPVDGWT